LQFVDGELVFRPATIALLLNPLQVRDRVCRVATERGLDPDVRVRFRPFAVIAGPLEEFVALRATLQERANVRLPRSGGDGRVERTQRAGSRVRAAETPVRDRAEERQVRRGLGIE